ncbi:MAG: lysylphosphatidylglycerol synthase transmembrane domain-containing protein [Anaerolineales bacterium]
MKSRKAQWIAFWIALLVLGLLLIIWSLQGVPFAEIGQVLSTLGFWQIAALLMVNIGILFLFPLRWWLIVRAQGYRVPYLALTQYRLVVFAISYFTPGQHFGGEPFQVLYLRNRHKMPGSTALASVTLDKVIELFANFAVLALGLAVLVFTGVVVELPLAQTLPISLVLLLVPSIYLVSVRFGARPLRFLAKRLSGGLAEGIRNAEEQLGSLAKEKPGLLGQGLLIAIAVWVALIFEIWLLLFFLSLPVDALELTLVIVAARVALFAPTPGALGALEASQVLAMQALGYSPAYGIGLALLIRARDVLFGLVGLSLAGIEQGQQ